VEVSGGKQGTIMTIRQDLPQVRPIASWCGAAGRTAGLEEFRVVYGRLAARRPDRHQTRSAFQILTELGTDVEAPAEHIAELRTYAPAPEPQGDPALPPLVRILSGTSKPDDAFAAVEYGDHWYWIEDRDFRSKGTITFLMITMTLAEKGEALQAPLVTIQGN
jgi:hypothetical protein